MTTEQSKSAVERGPIKYTEHLGMQLRLLTMEQLDPSQNYPFDKTVVQDKFSNPQEIDQRVKKVAGLIDGCSNETRLKEQGATPYDEAMLLWAEKVTKIIQAHGSKHLSVMQRLGLGKPEEFTEVQAKALYDQFTDPTTTKSLVEKFTEDTLRKYYDTDNRGRFLNLKALRADLDSLQWLAGIFGKDEAEMAVNLLMAQVESLSSSDQYIEAALIQAKALSPREQQLLQKLADKQQPVDLPQQVEPQGNLPLTQLEQEKVVYHAEVIRLFNALGGDQGLFTQDDIIRLIQAPEGKKHLVTLEQYVNQSAVGARELQTIREVLENAFHSDKVIAFAVDRAGLTFQDNLKMDVYRIVAQHLGYDLTNFSHSQTAWTVQADISQLPE